AGSASPARQDTSSVKTARALKRFGKDQSDIYSAPFRVRNLKWDALVLAGTAGLIATDRQASRALPTTHLDLSRSLSNAGLVGTASPARQDTSSVKTARALKRFGKDQSDIYSAPFRVRNLKWDALVLAGTAGLIATDRQASRALPTTHLDLSRSLSNAGLVGTTAAL